MQMPITFKELFFSIYSSLINTRPPDGGGLKSQFHFIISALKDPHPKKISVVFFNKKNLRSLLAPLIHHETILHIILLHVYYITIFILKDDSIFFLCIIIILAITTYYYLLVYQKHDFLNLQIHTPKISSLKKNELYYHLPLVFAIVNPANCYVLIFSPLNLILRLPPHSL